MKQLALSTLIFFNSAMATLPEYNAPEMLARADIYGGFNLPPMSLITDVSPVINEHGDVTFKVETYVNEENAQAIWYNGKIVYTAPDARLVTDPSINDQGKIAFSLFDEGITDGIFIFDSNTQTVNNVLPPTGLNLANFTYPTITNKGEIFFRGTDEQNIRSFFLFDEKLYNIVSEGNNFSYLFKPSINNLGFIASKVRVGDLGEWDESQPDQIVLLSLNSKQVIAEDKDSNASSPFITFDNSLAVNDKGMVAFVAGLENKQRGVFLYDNGKMITIALEGTNNISEIEKFPAKVNNQGMVLFRAKDKEGKRSIFLGAAGELKKIIGEGDALDSDLGKSEILFDKEAPGFGGEINFNSKGDIVFNAVLVGAEVDSEFGQAIYKMTVKK